MLAQVDDENFQEKIRGSIKPQVVYFTGSFCQPCKNFGPVVEKMSLKYTGDIEFLKADIEDIGVAAQELNIRSLPSLVLFDGGMVRDIKSGTMTAEEMRLWIQDNI